jgi:hypothetical protein
MPRLACLPVGKAGRKADPVIIFTFPGSPALWARSFTPWARIYFAALILSNTFPSISSNPAGTVGYQFIFFMTSGV